MTDKKGNLTLHEILKRTLKEVPDSKSFIVLISKLETKNGKDAVRRIKRSNFNSTIGHAMAIHTGLNKVHEETQEEFKIELRKEVEKQTAKNKGVNND